MMPGRFGLRCSRGSTHRLSEAAESVRVFLDLCCSTDWALEPIMHGAVTKGSLTVASFMAVWLEMQNIQNTQSGLISTHKLRTALIMIKYW